MCDVLNLLGNLPVLPRTDYETWSGLGRIAVRSGTVKASNPPGTGRLESGTGPVRGRGRSGGWPQEYMGSAPTERINPARGATFEADLAQTPPRTESPVNDKGPITARRHFPDVRTPTEGRASLVVCNPLFKRPVTAATIGSAATSRSLAYGIRLPAGVGHAPRVTQ